MVGLFRALGRSQLYRGKIFGPILATLSVLMFAFFSYVIFYELRQVPPSTGAPRVGEKAPTFTLPVKTINLFRSQISFHRGRRAPQPREQMRCY